MFKKPIRLAAISIFVQIALAIVFVILVVFYFLSLLSNSMASTILIIFVAILFVAMEVFSIFFYNGFLVLGRKFNQKMLSITSYIFIVWIIIVTILSLIAIGFLHPIIKKEFQNNQNIPSSLENITNPISKNIISQVSAEEINKELKNIPEEKNLEDISKNELDNFFENIPGWVYVLVIIALIPFFLIQIAGIFFALGIRRLDDKVKYAKTTGILGIISYAGGIFNLIFGVVIFAFLANPVALILISIFSNIIGMLFGLAGLVFIVFQIILLFKASAELEK